MSNNIFGYTVRQKMVPLGGPETPIQPPSYEDGKHAVSVDTRDGEGTLNVVLNSIPGEAHAMSEAMLAHLGGRDNAPGIFVGCDEKDRDMIRGAAAKEYKADQATVTEEEFCDIVENYIYGLDISTWTASHRQADAVIRHANEPGGTRQLWHKESEVGQLIRRAGNGQELAKNFPNSAILGFWLSARSPRPTRVARSLRSAITGYNATAVHMGAGKGDLLGNTPTVGMSISKDGEASLGGGKIKPSELGFGSIPGSASTVIGYRSKEILREATLSLRGLGTHLDVSPEMLEALEALATLGAIDGGSKGIYRSGADLIVVDTAVEQIDHLGNRTEVDAADLRTKALEQLETHRDLFAAPIPARMSSVIVSLVAARLHALMK